MNRILTSLRRLTAALAAVCLLAALTLPVYAEGEETEKLTVTISSVDDLLQLAKDCRLDSWSEGRTVLLKADLELTGTDFAGIPTFSGTFEGQHHTISGLSLVTDGSVTGLFRYVQKGGTVRDLTVRGRSMPTGTRTTVGGIAGSNAGTLQNCRFEGVSSGASVVGGIAGTNLSDGIINDCTTSGSVYGAHFIGGIAGENHGIIINCGNDANVNTTVEQNDVSLNELTLNDLIGTENAADITDIGGIVGTSSGVVRACLNRGTVGYQHMGYNVGGIAGSQTGYMEGCVNYGTVYARKEGGGIVGQMEPSSTLQYTKDTLQELSDEMTTLQALVNRACDDASAASSDLSNQLDSLKNSVTNSRNAIETLLQTTVDGLSVSSQTVKTDLTQFKQNLKEVDISGKDDDTDLPNPDVPGGTVTKYPTTGDDTTGGTTGDAGDTGSTGDAGGTTDAGNTGDTTQTDVPSEENTDTPTDTQAAPEAPAEENVPEVHEQPQPTADDKDTENRLDNDLDYTLDPREEFPNEFDTAQDILNSVSDALPNTVDVEVPKVELTNRDAVTASRNDLSSSLTGMGDIVSSLNNNASSNSQALLNDMRAISAQINKIGQTLSNASKNVTTDPDDLVDDISDEDTENDTEAKVYNCINQGRVEADINAGGIAGAMARENDLDPEDDYTTSGSQSLNFTMKTRVVVRECTNYGTVSAKKKNAGGIVGDTEMGTVISCLNLGMLDAEDAACVGGIVGLSKTSVRQSSAKCRLTGQKQVGGIVGNGTTVIDCRAMVVLDGGDEMLGAIAGTLEDPMAGESSGNTFVDEGCAAVDGVSYAGIAEPLVYSDFVQQEDLPEEFTYLSVIFRTEDDVIAQYRLQYGDSLPAEQFPVIPAKEGCYGTWDAVALNNLTFDATVNAEYTDNNTLRESEQSRDGRPILLVEGTFDTTAAVTLQELTDDAPNTADTVLEGWRFTTDGDIEHNMRYLPPDGTDGVTLYLRTADGWQKAETSVEGSYLRFTAPADITALAAVEAPQSPVMLVAVTAGAAVVVLVLLLLLRKRRKARKARKTEQPAEK